jgi:hypothetical protein
LSGCPCPTEFDRDATRLEIITVSIGYDDYLAEFLAENHSECDHIIVVTSFEDRATQAVCRRHGATCVPTDLHHKGGRPFNKGCAINAGFGYFQCDGWRLHLDCDILLPRNFRRMLFTHSHLERDCIYGADRVDVIGLEDLLKLRHAQLQNPQHMHHSGLSPVHGGAVYPKMPSASSARFISDLYGYVPIGFFQLWNASHQRPYPYSLGTAAHDDVLFAALWPESKRRLLPGAFVYHLNQNPPSYGLNWNGRRADRLK